MGLGGQRHAPVALPSGKRPGTNCIGSWVSPTAGLDGCGKSRPPPEFNPRTFEYVASRYTNYATNCEIHYVLYFPTLFLNSSLSGPDIFLSILCSNHPNRIARDQILHP